MVENPAPPGEDDPSDQDSMAVRGKHDALFRAWLGNPDAVRLLIRERLPQRMIALIEPGAPERIPGSFVDERLVRSFTDLLYRVRVKEGGSAYVYVLIEHSAP
jgi:hypothetical protein